MDRSDAPAMAALVACPSRSECPALLGRVQPGPLHKFLHHSGHVDSRQSTRLNLPVPNASARLARS